MADIPSAAQAIFPHLVSETASAPEPAPAPKAEASERSLAEKIYPEQGDGIDKARQTIAEGIAKPASETEAAAERGDSEGAAPSQLAQFNNLAREAGLSSARTEQMLKLHEEAMLETSTRYWADQGSAWEKQSKAQFGARLAPMVSTIQPLLNDRALTPPAFRNLLETYRIGNHPVVI